MQRKNKGISLGTLIIFIFIITILGIIFFSILKPSSNIVDISQIGGRNNQLLAANLPLGSTVEGRITLGNTATIEITGATNGSYKVTKVDGDFLEYDLNDNILTLKGKKEGTTEITIFEQNSNKYVTYRLTILPANYAITKDSKTINYGTLADAVSEVNSDDTITLLKDVTEKDTVEINKNLVLDLSSHKIIFSGVKTAITVAKNYTLNLKGSSNGELYISGDTVETTNDNIALEDHIAINNNGKLNVESGKITGVCSGKSGIGIYNMGTTNITGGEIRGIASGQINGIGIENYGELTISEGIIHGETQNIEDEIKIGLVIGILNSTHGNININGGEITGYKGIWNLQTNSKATINSGTIEGSKIGVENTGNLIIGDPSQKLNNNSPSIQGGEYGVQNDRGVFKFYNGSLIGKTSGYRDISGHEPILRNDTEIVTGESGEYKTASLSLTYNFIIEKNNNILRYSKLQEAIDGASSGDTIKVCQNVTLDSAVTVNKNITIDFQEYKIEAGNNTITVTNGTNLNLGDENYGFIFSLRQDGYTIINYGTLNIKNIAVYTISKNTEDDICVINNIGTLIIDERAYIHAYGDKKVVGIENNGGNIKVINGKIDGGGSVDKDDNGFGKTNAKVYGIYNNSGTVTIGEANKIIDTENPNIMAYFNDTSSLDVSNEIAYGVYNQGGTFNFYNGIIKGVLYYNVEPKIDENTEVITIDQINNEGMRQAYLKSKLKDLSDYEVTLSENTYTYDGTEKKPEVVVKNGEQVLALDTDYTVTYANNINASEDLSYDSDEKPSITIKGINDYIGEITKKFTIDKKSISNCSINEIENQTYTGSQIKPTVSVNDGSTKLSSSKDYEISYTNNTNVGTATVTITGNGNYKGTITATFKIIDNTAPELTVSYSPSTATNGSVTATITSNKLIQKITGWTLSSDGKSLSKIYTTNTSETVTVSDLEGNKSTISVIVDKIDKTAIEADVKYSTSDQTTDDVEVIISTNKTVQSVSGWSLASDGKVLRKTFTENSSEKVILKDSAGNTKEVLVEVKNIDKNEPELEINYEKTDNSVTVTIRSNELIEKIDGWTLSTDGKVLTKTYTSNTSEKITIKDLAGNEKEVTISISGIIDNTNESKTNSDTSTSENNTANSGTSTSGTTTSSTTQASTAKTDSTTANKIIPKAGITALKIIGFIVIAIVSIFAFKKYYNMRDVK